MLQTICQFSNPVDYRFNPAWNTNLPFAFSTMTCTATGTLPIASGTLQIATDTATDTLPMVLNGFTYGEVVISVFLFVLLLQALAYKLLKLLKIV